MRTAVHLCIRYEGFICSTPFCHLLVPKADSQISNNLCKRCKSHSVLLACIICIIHVYAALGRIMCWGFSSVYYTIIHIAFDGFMKLQLEKTANIDELRYLVYRNRCVLVDVGFTHSVDQIDFSMKPALIRSLSLHHLLRSKAELDQFRDGLDYLTVWRLAEADEIIFYDTSYSSHCRYFGW